MALKWPSTRASPGAFSDIGSRDYPMAPPHDTSAAAHPDRSAFMSVNTRVARALLVPAIELHLAT